MPLRQEIECWAAALLSYDTNDYEKTIQLFSEMEPNSKILFNLGVIYASMADHQTAIEYYASAIKRDKYMAIAYFQMGVSNFLLGEFNEAVANFNDALHYLRGNIVIDYGQLGLKYRLYTCEILFNRGLSYIYDNHLEEGMTDLEYAKLEKKIPIHNVIDEAISAQGDGYIVFSVPVGVLFRPPEAKVKNIRPRDYLGKARIVAGSPLLPSPTLDSNASNKYIQNSPPTPSIMHTYSMSSNTTLSNNSNNNANNSNTNNDIYNNSNNNNHNSNHNHSNNNTSPDTHKYTTSPSESDLVGFVKKSTRYASKQRKYSGEFTALDALTKSYAAMHLVKPGLHSRNNNPSDDEDDTNKNNDINHNNINHNNINHNNINHNNKCNNKPNPNHSQLQPRPYSTSTTNHDSSMRDLSSAQSAPPSGIVARAESLNYQRNFSTSSVQVPPRKSSVKRMFSNPFKAKQKYELQDSRNSKDTPLSPSPLSPSLHQSNFPPPPVPNHSHFSYSSHAHEQLNHSTRGSSHMPNITPSNSNISHSGSIRQSNHHNNDKMHSHTSPDNQSNNLSSSVRDSFQTVAIIDAYSSDHNSMNTIAPVSSSSTYTSSPSNSQTTPQNNFSYASPKINSHSSKFNSNVNSNSAYRNSNQSNYVPHQKQLQDLQSKNSQQTNPFYNSKSLKKKDSFHVGTKNNNNDSNDNQNFNNNNLSDYSNINDIRVKIHYNNDTRITNISQGIKYEEFYFKISEKLGTRSFKDFKITARDDDGDLVVLADQEDLDVIISNSISEAKINGQYHPRIEIWTTCTK